MREHSDDVLAADGPEREALEAVYDELDRLGTREVEAETFRPRIELFHWPLAAFLILCLAEHAAVLGRRAMARRRTAHG